jgi:GH15 family glucan-1,4-alpha-glucosidase
MSTCAQISVRDQLALTPLSVEALVSLGAKEDARRYLECLSKLISSIDPPLQPVYGIHGETKLSQEERNDLEGYRGSKPVRLGNRAYRQDQHGSMGYLVDCMYAYLEQGGDWRPEFWELTRRVADWKALKCLPESTGSCTRTRCDGGQRLRSAAER